MNWKRVARACMCLLVVCCVLLNICAVPAKATSAGALAATSLAVPGVNVIAPILIGLGVLYVVGSTDWDNVVRDCANALQEAGILDSDGNLTIFKPNSSDGGLADWFVNLTIVEAIRSWLWENNVLLEDTIVTTGTGFKLVVSNSASTEVKAFWKSVDLYMKANSASPGQIMALATWYESLPCYIWGLSRMSTTYGFDVLNVVGSGSSGSISPYTSLDFAVGEFVNLDFHTSADGGLYAGRYDYGSYAKTIFLSYEHAYTAYANSYGDLDYFFFLTPESYIVPYSTQAASTGFSDVMFTSIANLGRISSGGEVSYGTYGITCGSGYDSYQYTFAPGSIELDYVPGTSVGKPGYIAGKDEDLTVGYPGWFGNSSTISDPDTGEESIVLPLPSVDSSTKYEDVSQEEVWVGQLSDAIVDANTGTVAGTPIGDFWAGLTDAIVNPLLEGIASIFVPSQDFLSAKVDAIRSEFSFADSIISTVDFFGKGLQGVETKPPVIYIDLGASTGDYNMGGRVVFMDLSWYEEYKPLGDALISAFLWAVFAWRVFMKLPGLVSGMPGDFVMDSLQGVGADRMLPFRKKEHETVRRLNRRV